MDGQPVLSAFSSARNSLEDQEGLDWRKALMETPNAVDPFNRRNVATTALRTDFTMSRELKEHDLTKLESIAPFEYGADAEYEKSKAAEPLPNITASEWQSSSVSYSCLPVIKRNWKILSAFVFGLVIIAIITSLTAVLVIAKRGSHSDSSAPLSDGLASK